MKKILCICILLMAVNATAQVKTKKKKSKSKVKKETTEPEDIIERLKEITSAKIVSLDGSIIGNELNIKQVL